MMRKTANKTTKQLDLCSPRSPLITSSSKPWPRATATGWTFMTSASGPSRAPCWPPTKQAWQQGSRLQPQRLTKQAASLAPDP